MKGFRFSLLAIASVLLAACDNPVADDDVYAGLPFEMPRVELPSIPSRSVVLTDFGGVGDGVALNTEAFAQAIDHLARLGGGRLVVPAEDIAELKAGLYSFTVQALPREGDIYYQNSAPVNGLRFYHISYTNQ